jgi:iron complex transport system substrate-binding protein
MKNTTKSIKILGKLLGREAEATEFVDYYNAQMARVTDRLAKKTTTPDVFIEVRVGLGDDCCFTMANGMMGRFIEFAGGRNIAVGIVPGVAGTMNPEYLLASQPDVYIGTAIGAAHTMEQTPERIALGAGVDAGLARVSLKHSMQRPAMQALIAVRDGRAHAIWHHFYNSPLNVYAVQVFAKWLHPDLFDDLDPEQTMRTLYHRFQPVELDGVYAISLTAP